MLLLNNLLQRLPEAHARIGRFLISGGTAAATNFSILFILTEFFDIWYLFSSIAAVACAIVVNFTLQKFWTFTEPEMARIPAQLGLFIGVALMNLVLNTLMLYTLVEWLHLWYLYAQVLSAAALGCLSYYLYKAHIFTQ